MIILIYIIVRNIRNRPSEKSGRKILEINQEIRLLSCQKDDKQWNSKTDTIMARRRLKSSKGKTSRGLDGWSEKSMNHLALSEEDTSPRKSLEGKRRKKLVSCL